MEIATKIAPLALALIMFGLGLSLSIQDFLRLTRFPKVFLVGFICQLILLPIIAFSITLLFSLPVELSVGLMLIACAPGGVTSNILTKFADGDVALSITMTAIISLISIFSVPFIIFTYMDFFQIDTSEEVSMTGIALKMFFVVTIPVIIGMLVRKFAKNFVDNQTSLIQKSSVILFVLVFIAIYIEEWDNIISYILNAGLIALILNISMMIVGFYAAKYFTSEVGQQRAISLECGLQNGTLAVFVGTQIFEENITSFITPTAAYALIMMVTSLIFVFLVKKNT